jgi:hypothetical protein
MKQPHQPNANPYVEKIVQAYLQTQMNDRQFEALVEETIALAKAEGGGGNVTEAYDKGFSDGYDSAMAEGK